MNDPEETRLTVLGGPELLCHGRAVPLPLNALRLLSYLALQSSDVPRPVAAEALWPDQRAHRSSANLRSALWQSRRIGTATVVDCVSQRIRLATEVRVDLREVTDCVHRIHTTTGAPPPSHGSTAYRDLVDALSRNLLPDWTDPWVQIERERWDQVRLHALEILARHLLTAGEHLPAMDVALTAIGVEPVRESAHRTVVEIHLAEGNSGCAIKHYQRYRSMLRRELGVPPSPQMDRLIHPLVGR